MAEERVQRRLAAILTADVVGYSSLMEKDESGTRARFNDQLENVIKPALDEHHGRLVKTMGDGFLVEFGSVVDSVQCAVDIQNGVVLQQNSGPDDKNIEFRIGLHLGDVIVEGDDIHGDGINIASRLEAIAEPGGICVSDMVYAGVRNKLSLDFDDLGEQPLKNIAHPMQIYRIIVDHSANRDAPQNTAIFRRPAVAVLPFENLSGDPEQEYFADGLTEDVITALLQWRFFPVIARNSTFAYKGQSPDIRKVGSELGARYVVEGSVRKAGNRVRVTAQLINSDNGHHVWAERYDRDLEDIFDLQDEVTRQIVAALMPELQRAEHDRSGAKPTDNLDAWDCYLRGNAYFNELTPEAIPKAREMFERATALDPNYAKAYARLGLTYHRELLLGLRDDTTGAARLLMEAASKAATLDDSDSMSHWVLSLANFYKPLGASDIAISEAKRSLALNPADVDAIFTCGTSLVNCGRCAEAIPHIELALKISPRDPRRPLILLVLTCATFFAHRLEDAEQTALECLSIGTAQNTPEAIRTPVQVFLVATLGHMGRTEDARMLLGQAGEAKIKEGAAALKVGRGIFCCHDIPDAEKTYLFEGLGKAGLPEN